MTISKSTIDTENGFDWYHILILIMLTSFSTLPNTRRSATIHPFFCPSHFHCYPSKCFSHGWALNFLCLPNGYLVILSQDLSVPWEAILSPFHCVCVLLQEPGNIQQATYLNERCCAIEKSLCKQGKDLLLWQIIESCLAISCSLRHL